MNRKRPKQIVIRLSDIELQKIKKKVKGSGLNQQTYIIKALTDKAIINPNILQPLITQLSRIGNNLNQIARKCNNNKTDVLVEVIKIQKECENLWQQLNLHL